MEITPSTDIVPATMWPPITDAPMEVINWQEVYSGADEAPIATPEPPTLLLLGIVIVGIARMIQKWQRSL